MSKLNLPPVPSSEITPRDVWQGRRRWLKTAALGSLAVGAGGVSSAWAAGADAATLNVTANQKFALDEPVTDRKLVTTYNNFYEFGTDKGDPARNAGRLQTRPWTVTIEGEVLKPRTFDIDDLLKLAPLEERVYRMRCVEGWSMVIPWNGYSLSTLLSQVQPTGNARFVEFVTAVQPDNMPGVRSRIIDWPYREGLRIDEAMHPLTMLVMGIYGEVLPNQNGAPVRLAVPWKYGFKSAKSIVTIRLLEKQPVSSWERIQPQEYGFYANVNPTVSHPRWSQATERRIGAGFLAPRRDTLMFNGYT